MPAMLSSHLSPSEKPIVLVLGNNIITEHVMNSLLSSCRVVHIGRQNFIPKAYADNYSFIKAIDADLISRVKDTIHYAVLFLDSTEQKSIFKELLPKLEKNNTKTSVLISVRSVSDFFDVIVAYKSHRFLSFLLTGDIVDPELPEEFTLSQEIHKAIVQKKVVLTGNDLSPVFPISLTDFTKCVLYSLFGDLKKSKVLYVFYSIPQTRIALVHTLRRIEPELDVRFQEQKNRASEESSIESISRTIQMKTLLNPVYFQLGISDFENSVKSFTDHDLPMVQRHSRLRRRTSTPYLRSKSKVLRNKFIANAVLIGILLFIFIQIALTAAGVFYGQQAIRALSRNDLSEARTSASRSLQFISLTYPTVDLAAQGLLRIAPSFQPLQNFYLLSDSVSLASTAFYSILPSIEEFPKGISKNKIDTLIADMQYLYFQSIRLSQNNVAQIESFTNQPYSDYLSLTPVLPEILGYSGKRTYLLLFQNNGELRPNGGFIGSIGKITFDQGKSSDILIQDVYEPDGQLKAHIEPHFIVRRHLQPHMYLRDSNFNLNFQVSATYAAQLYFLETGTKVDGVIALDFEVMRRIIEKVGPITLPSYNKTVDKDNAFAFLQQTIEDDFFPGSTEKRDVLNELFTELMFTLEQDQNNLYSLAQILPGLMKEKHILFAFRNPATQQIFTLNNLGGTLHDFRTKSSDTIHDFLSINEANIGVNKANTAIEREVAYKADVREEGIYSLVQLDLHNKYDKHYRTYIRIVVPNGSTIENIIIDGQEQKITEAVTDYAEYEDPRFKAPEGLEVDTAAEEGYTTFGFISEVNPGRTQSIQVEYTNGVTVNKKPSIEYSFLYIKQPGTLSYPLNITLNHADSFVVRESEDWNVSDNNISTAKVLNTDSQFRLSLIRK